MQRETSPNGRHASTGRSFQMDTLPWRLYERAKQQTWNPAEIDLSSDVGDWAELSAPRRRMIARLATQFLAGEEAVTLDILPLMRAISEEGRLEETMFLTTFVGDEAKHTEFFRRWFDAVGFDEPLEDLLVPTLRWAFYEELPRVLGRLDTDRSPQAVLDAALTYNHFIEGVLAVTGYRAWNRIFTRRGILAGMRAGLDGVQRDERRHIAYGTYVCRRIIAEHPELWEYASERMSSFREKGNNVIMEVGVNLFQEAMEVPEIKQALEEGRTGSDDLLLGEDPQALLNEFFQDIDTQVRRRLEVIEVARRTERTDLARGGVEEEVEEELEEA